MNTTVFAPAKINLWLRVFPPDATGYHPLDTLFSAIDLADRIEIDGEYPGLNLTVAGADVGPVDQNLAYRAAYEFFRAAGRPPYARLHLTKNIPAGAGLGGGSSDAAAVLSALNELHDDVLSTNDLMTIGARLGSDVPFFLCGSHLAHATGRGEKLQAVAALPAAAALIIAPSFNIATTEAYRWLDERSAYSRQTASNMDVACGWEDVAKLAHNDFEAVLFERYPVLRSFRDALHDSGATIALLSGSGSALFGIYADNAARDDAGMRLEQQLNGVTVLRASTLT